MQKQPIYIALGALVLIAGLIYFLHRVSAQPAASGTASSTATNIPTIPLSGTTTTTTLPNGATVTVTMHQPGSPSGLTADQAYAQLQLGIDKKNAGDYAGAAQVWITLTQEAPANYIAYADLGDLYMNFLKDYPKAEASYSTAIKIDPTDIDLYRNLYTLYVWQGNTAAASSTLAMGLKANPGNPDLLTLQQQLQSHQ